MNERKKKSRRWLSFSLRTALVLLTCFGLWLGWFVPRVQKQKRVAEWVRSMGGLAEYGFQFDSAGKHVPDASPSIPRWLTSNLGFDCFYSIQCVVVPLPDESNELDLSPVASLHDLRYLMVRNGGIAELTPLQNLSRLEVLVVGDSPIDDISALANLKNLKNLKVGNSKIHDIEPLRGLRDLEVVSLGRTDIADLSPLSDHQKLNYLLISKSNVSDVSPLRTCQALSTLIISKTKVSDISPLRTCRTLRLLDVSETNVSPADVEALQVLLPDCTITPRSWSNRLFSLGRWFSSDPNPSEAPPKR